MNAPGNFARVEARFAPKAPPEWLAVLAKACDAETQTRVARRLDYSTAVVNQALKGTYKGDLKAVEAAVRGRLMSATVECPALGIIHSDQCQKFQRQKFSAHNPDRVRVWRACRSGCPHSRLKAEVDNG